MSERDDDAGLILMSSDAVREDKVPVNLSNTKGAYASPLSDLTSTDLTSLLVSWSVGWINLFNTELYSKRVLAGTEIPGGGGRGRLYTLRYTVTTRMTPALRWAEMRAVLMFR